MSKTCKTDGCTNKARCAGLCAKHYKRIDCYARKLRGKHEITVAGDIKRWRERLKKQGIVLGAHRAKQLEEQAVRSAKEMPAEDLIAEMKKRFG